MKDIYLGANILNINQDKAETISNQARKQGLKNLNSYISHAKHAYIMEYVDQ